MKLKFGKVHLLLSALTVGAVAIGCGGNGATNNDQGVSVSLLGFFSEFGEGCDSLPTGQTGLIIPLGSAATEPPTSSGPTGEQSSSSVDSILGLQNNLFGQFFRGDRLVLSYFIPGADVQPPSTTVPLSVFIDAPQPADDAGLRVPGNTSLPPTNSSSCNRSFAATTVLPASVRTWMNTNRTSLPEPPFQMEIVAYVSGVSTSGNRYNTNTERLYVEITPEEPVVEPSTGDDTTDTAGDSSEVIEGSATTETGSDTTTDTSTDTNVEDLGNAIDTTDDTGSSSL